MKKYEGKRFEVIDRELAEWDMMDMFASVEDLIDYMKKYPDTFEDFIDYTKRCPDVFEDADELPDWDEIVFGLTNDDIAFIISDESSYSLEDIYVVDECEFDSELESRLAEYDEEYDEERGE